MTEIIPAIMPRNLSELENSAARVLGAAEYVQVDVMDGKFVPDKSWPFPNFDAETAQFANEDKGLPFWENVNYEFDLMIEKPEEFAEQFVRLGGGRIIIHLESAEKEAVKEAIGKVKAMDTEAGLAINTDTPDEELDEFLSDSENKPDFVQFMGIARIGYQGEPFDERVIPKIRALRAKYPDIMISVDGGVNFDSAPALIEAGADRLVSGSAIFGSGDAREAIYELKNI